MTDRELNELLVDALDSLSWEMVYKAQQALRDRLAHPESVHAIDISQERVDETVKDRHDLTCVCGAVWVGEEMVCSPRKREWVGLTDDEVLACDPSEECWNLLEVARAIEAKLKEKNT